MQSELPLGTVLGNYRLERVIGSGGMGTVYEAWHTVLDKRVAMKVLQARHANDTDALERFVREGKAASRIRHPHVVEVIDAGEMGGVTYLVMEYLHGEDLEAFLKRKGALGLEQSLDILLPVLDAVAAAHAAGIVHRDLKPANIFLVVGPQGGVQPKVLDFGVSKLVEGRSSLTGAATLIGTPHYMPPEQVQGAESATAQSDQYSLATILYECVTGQHPHERQSLVALLHAITDEPPRPVRELRPDLPVEFERVLSRALAKDPEDRFASLAELSRALLPFSSETARAYWAEPDCFAQASEVHEVNGFESIAIPTQGAPRPEDEEERLRALYSYEILDTVEDEAFDDIGRLCAQLCETPISLITLVDRKRQWFKTHIGLDERETERECSFCAHAIMQEGWLLVPDTTRDARFVDNRLVLGGPEIRFYAGVPIHARGGLRIGTLCAIDTVPRHLRPEQRRALYSLARRVDAELELRRVQREKDRLGRFIAHDLKSQLLGVVLGVDRLMEQVGEQHTTAFETLSLLEDSTRCLSRMVAELQDVFAHQSGELRPQATMTDLQVLLDGLRGRLQRQLDTKGVQLETSLPASARHIQVDPELLRRIIENLVVNAFEASPENGRIRISTVVEGEQFVLRVGDQGPGVPAQDRERVFQLGERGPEGRGGASRGLGLAFARMAARAMGGDLVYEDDSGGACFKLSLRATVRSDWRDPSAGSAVADGERA